MADSKEVDVLKDRGITHKQGHVTIEKDSKVKCDVYRITGGEPSLHFVSVSNLSLPHRYLYILFRPFSRKYFIIKFELCLKDKREAVLVSISNVINKVKISSDSLDIPYSFNETTLTSQATPTPDNSCWTCLVIDHLTIASDYWGRGYECINSVQICANVLLKSLITSDNLYHPHTNDQLLTTLLPVPKGLMFEDIHHYRLLPQYLKPHPPIRTVKVTHKPVTPAQQLSYSLSLNKLIGSCVASNNHVVFSNLGNKIFYICHSVIVAMETKSAEQEFFIGHTDRVLCITLSRDDNRLASAQLGGVVRLWDVTNVSCVTVIKSQHQLITGLSLSYDGGTLVCVSKGTGRSVLTIWSNDDIIRTITDVDINVLRISPFDNNRMVSCGWNNIRFWRVKDSSLKSSPVNLMEYHNCYYTDIKYHSSTIIYSSTSSGCIVEVEYHSFSLKRVWQLFPDTPGGVAITSLALHEGFVVTGSVDGFVRLWPIDFKHVTMETKHDNPVVSVGVAKNGLQVLSASKCLIGILDATNKRYKTVLRSHTDTITDISHNKDYIITVSNDATIRIWDNHSFEQVYQFDCEEGVRSVCVDIHPFNNDIASGYNDGILRFFNLNGSILSQHMHDSSLLRTVLFTTDGRKCFSADNNGTIGVYDASHNGYPLLTLLNNIFSTGRLILMNDNNSFGFIGPLPSVVSIYSIKSLEMLCHIDVGIKDQLPVDICYTDNDIGHVIILTNQNKVLKYSSFNGQFISEFIPSHKVSSVIIINKLLITGDNNGNINLMNYHTPSDTSLQSYIGINGPVGRIMSFDNYLISISHNTVCHWIMTPPTNDLTPPTNNILTLPNNDTVLPRDKSPLPLLLNERVEPELTTPTTETDEIIISKTHQGGVELTFNTPTRKPQQEVVSRKPKKCYKYHQPIHNKPHQLLITPPTKSISLLHRIYGYNKNGRNNLKWSIKKGLIIYSSGCVCVIDDLSNNSNQKLIVGHNTEILTLALSNDGWSLASASHAHNDWPCEVRLWSLESCECTEVLHHHINGVNCIEYSLDDRFILSVGEDLVLCIYNINDNVLVVSTKLKEPVTGLAWDYSNAYEFSTVNECGVSFWILEEKSGTLQVYTPSTDKEATSLCYNCNNYLYVGYKDGSVIAWYTYDNSCTFKWLTGCREISSMVCNNNKLIVGDIDGLVQLWLINPSDSSPTAVLDFSVYVVGGIYSMTFDPSLTMGLIGSSSIFFINWTERTTNDLMYGHHDNINGVAYSSDGRVFVSCDNHVTTVWSTTAWTTLLQYKSKNVALAIELIDHTHQYICAVGYNDGSLAVFNITSGRVIAVHHPLKDPIIKIISSHKDSSILCGTSTGAVISMDLYNGIINYKISSHNGSAITDIDRIVFKVGLPGVISINEEVWLISSIDQRISIWINNILLDWITLPSLNDEEDKEELLPTLSRFCPTEPDHIIFSVGYGIEKCLRIYSLTQKTVIKKLSLNYWPTCISLSPNGQLIATGSREQVLTLIDNDGLCQESSVHCDTVSTVIFSPNGDQLVSCSQYTFHVWKLN